MYKKQLCIIFKRACCGYSLQYFEPDPYNVRSEPLKMGLEWDIISKPQPGQCAPTVMLLPDGGPRRRLESLRPWSYRPPP